MTKSFRRNGLVFYQKEGANKKALKDYIASVEEKATR